MANDITPIDPARFGLASFAEILPRRLRIVGEDHDSFETFHAGLMRSLAPMTPYECVVAENLVRIEWDLVQHGRMKEAALRRHTHEAIRDAFIALRRQAHGRKQDEAWTRHLDAGGSEEDWAPEPFDDVEAEEIGEHFARLAVSDDAKARRGVEDEITRLGLSPLDLMSEAYASAESHAHWHDAKIQDLERRRREVKSDYDRLQKTRPIEAEVFEG